MSQIRLVAPEFDETIVMDHDDFFKRGCSNGDVFLNLRFDKYELEFSYPTTNPTEKFCELCGDDVTMAGTGIPELFVKKNNTGIYHMSFNNNWILQINIKKKSNKYRIHIMIANDNQLEDGDKCEICENNEFNFDLSSLVDSYTLCFYRPPKGEFMKHGDPMEELPEDVKEKLK